MRADIVTALLAECGLERMRKIVFDDLQHIASDVVLLHRDLQFPLEPSSVRLKSE